MLDFGHGGKDQGHAWLEGKGYGLTSHIIHDAAVLERHRCQRWAPSEMPRAIKIVQGQEMLW